MTTTEIKSQALRMSERDRLELASELWASVDDPNLHSEVIALPQWQKELLDERLAQLEESPEQGSSWEEVEKRIWPPIHELADPPERGTSRGTSLPVCSSKRSVPHRRKPVRLSTDPP